MIEHKLPYTDPHGGVDAPEATDRDFVSYLGSMVRRLRKEKHMTQLDLARQVGITNGQISTIERGVSSPSISTLHKISRVLGVPMSEFFQDVTSGQVSVVRSGQGTRTAEAGQTFLDLLTRKLSTGSGLSAYVLHVDHEDLKIATKPGPGHEYFLYVLGGTCTLGVAGQNYSLEPGDTAYVNAHEDQWIRNAGAVPFRALIVSPAPLTRTEVRPPLVKAH